MKQQAQTKDLVIIGGGIMGLMTAYWASSSSGKVVILEKRTIGNKQAASFSFTRSLRTDYLDPLYARLADEARCLWLQLEQQADGRQLFTPSGCLNIAKRSITPTLEQTYAAKSYDVIAELSFGPQKFDKRALKARFPQFAADLGTLDTKGGYLNLPAITETLLAHLRKRGVTIVEDVETDKITDNGKTVRIATSNGELRAKKVVITTGIWTNNVLARIAGNKLRLPLTSDKPKECKYFYPSADKRRLFLPQNFPVFAYLDIGIYGHPIFDEAKGAVKISYYNPTDFTGAARTKVQGVADFVRECLPALQGVRFEDVTDADQCVYDLPEDDNFIIGSLPRAGNILVGTGWRGTGYKFSPLIGKILAQLALQKGTVYDITTFLPGRFES